MVEFRSAEGAPAAPVVVGAPLAASQIEVNLRSTTVVALKRAAANGVDQDLAMQRAFVSSSGSSSRLSLSGGRGTIDLTSKTDPNAEGWARVTSGKTCAFCSLLAARGPVYKSDTVGFRTHDYCDCGAELVYGGWDPQPHVRDLQDAYASLPPGLSGNAAVAAFRKATGLP